MGRNSQVFFYSESLPSKRKVIVSYDIAVRSQWDFKNVAGCFVCNGNRAFPQEYLGRDISQKEEGRLSELLDGEFIAFPQHKREVTKTIYCRGPPPDLSCEG